MKTADASHSSVAKLPLCRVRHHVAWFLLLLAAALGVAGGCQRRPPAGGSTSPKAEKARRQAERLAEIAVSSAAEAYTRSQPQTHSGGPLERWWRHTRQTLGLNTPETPKAPRELLPPPVESPAAIQLPAHKIPAHETELRPKSLPRPGPPAVIRERVVNRAPRRTVEEAEEDALTVAAERLTERFAEMDPPLQYHPKREEIRQEYMRRDSREVIPFRQRLSRGEPRAQQLQPILPIIAGPDGPEHLFDVEFDIEVTSEQIRYLRSRQRLEATVPVLLLVMLIFFSISVWFRLDDWSHGYLSRWFFPVVVALVAGALGFWYFS